MSALSNFARIPATQMEQARPDQVKNNAGGYAFTVSDIQRLERFLILGTDGGTYYVGEKDLTQQNVDFIRKMIREDPRCVLNTVKDVSDKGRAYRNEAAIFVMALLLTEAPADFKQTVVDAVPSVVRIATHAYQLAAFIEGLGGWGRAKRRAISKWFEDKTPEQLAYQAVKYRQRNGWTLRDLMRLSHPTGVDQRIGGFILGYETNPGGDIIDGFQTMQLATSTSEVISTLNRYTNLPWETIPTQFLKDPEVWKTLFANGQLKGQALVRNITRLSRNGAFNDMVFTRQVADMLTDSDMIAKSRLHPIQYLLALVTHQEGQMDRGNTLWFRVARKKDWITNSVIVDALNAGFHSSFKTITPAGKRTLLALDVSGSMAAAAMGIDLTCSQVSAAMAMVIARTEPYHQIMGFSSDFRDLGISASMDLGTVTRQLRGMTFGGTDCSKPMTWAMQNKIEIDTFAVMTDSETWYGNNHPYKALQEYRKKMGIDAKLAVFGVEGNPFTIADPTDVKGSMDFVGFDSSAASVFADFSAGRL